MLCSNSLRNIYIGVSDVTPVPLTERHPEDLEMTLCSFIKPKYKFMKYSL